MTQKMVDNFEFGVDAKFNAIDFFGYFSHPDHGLDLHVEMVDDHGFVLDEDNNWIPCKKSTKNLKKMIDSHFDESNIIPLLDRVAATGDASILIQRDVTYGDATQIPNSLVDLHNATIAGQELAAKEGINLNESDLDEYIKKAVADALAAKVEVKNESEVK